VTLAQTAIDQLQLDLLLVVPTGHAWHKTRDLTPTPHRLAMCSLAFAQVVGAMVDDRETRRAGPSYTADTLREVHLEHPDAALFLIIGEDQALALPSWHRIEEVRRAATICVAERSTSDSGQGTKFQQSLDMPEVQLLHMPPVPISATEIRQKAGSHDPFAPLVFAPVARYIEHHHLYQSA
jgi:nicotinate-nucleotide adenylyltransferase